MIQGLHDWDFVGGSLETVEVLLDIVDALQSHLFPGEDVWAQLHTREVTLASVLEEMVLTVWVSQVEMAKRACSVWGLLLG